MQVLIADYRNKLVFIEILYLMLFVNKYEMANKNLILSKKLTQKGFYSCDKQSWEQGAEENIWTEERWSDRRLEKTT
jgi:hypothetical protein